jgi:hypothetical protein
MKKGVVLIENKKPLVLGGVKLIVIYNFTFHMIRKFLNHLQFFQSNRQSPMPIHRYQHY